MYVAYRYSGYCAMMEQRFEAISSSERIRVSARIVYVLCRDVSRHDSRWRLRSTAAFMFAPGDNQPNSVNERVPQNNLPLAACHCYCHLLVSVLQLCVTSTLCNHSGISLAPRAIAADFTAADTAMEDHTRSQNAVTFDVHSRI